MRSSYRNNLRFLLLISFMVIGTFSSGAPVEKNSDGTCPSGRTIAKVGSSADSLTDKCVFKTKIVFDCQYYSDDASSTCTCDSTKDAEQLAVYLDTRLACVPELKQVVNCPSYTRLGAHNYVCSKCPTQAPYLVSVSTAGSNSIPKACSKHRFPNCQVYQVQTNTFQIGLDTAGGLVIGCKTCKTGFTQFATDNAAGFTYLGETDNGVACPKDGSYECTAMEFIDNKYVCDCGTNELVKFRTIGAQTIEQGCLATTAALYDANCGLYTYNADDDLVECYTCASGYYLLENVVGPAASDLFTFCFKYEIEGCSTYATTGADAGAAANLDDVWCMACGNAYTLIQTATDTIDNNANVPLGYCGADSRGWIIETSVCNNYAKPNFNTDLYLVCSQCKANVGDLAPCYADASARAGGCSDGALSAEQYGNTAAQICVVIGIIDNCKVYTSFDLTFQKATGCSQCKSGYSLVNTTSTTGTKFCIPDGSKVENCAVYNNKDLTCAICNSGLPYDVQNSRCRTADEAGVQCSRAVQVGTQYICIACPLGYTVVNNKCVVGVSKCSQFDVNGLCIACINGFRLINRNCIEVPANCAIVNSDGDCSSCKAGFEFNSNKKCQVSTRNTCYAGLVPLNGQCVPVQQPIRGCVTYTLDSKCDECIEGYVPSSGKNECVRITSSENPNLKPCPPNTSRIVYKRNPSNPFGDCVAVDVNCANPRDDGYCIECKQGEFAHSDGLCYKIVYSN